MIASYGYARVYFEKPWSKNHISVDLLGIQQAEEVSFRTTKAHRDPSSFFVHRPLSSIHESDSRLELRGPS